MPAKRIVASGVKRLAKSAQSPDRTLSLKAATCLAARSLIGSSVISVRRSWSGKTLVLTAATAVRDEAVDADLMSAPASTATNRML
jgi:hypothetical protein